MFVFGLVVLISIGKTMRTVVHRLEGERDFYKDPLDSPGTRREIPPPAVEEDASDTGPA